MSTNSYPIVGMFHHPPAQALVDALAIGTPLLLVAEPTNRFDANAIGVWLNAKDLSAAARATLDKTLPQYGHSWESIQAEGAWMLGYIPRAFAATLKNDGTVTDDESITVTFATNAQGAPRVRFDEGMS